jgi:hypothetical protein
MYRIRQIFGLTSLLLASVGPMPSWLHQFQCHSLHCDGHHSVVHEEVVYEEPVHEEPVHEEAVESGAVGHVHRSYEHAAHERLSEGHLCSGDVALEQGFEQDLDEVAEQRVEVAGLGSVPGHDCLVCYQLSQATAWVLVAADCPRDSSYSRVLGCEQQFFPAWSLGLYGPRGPPRL